MIFDKVTLKQGKTHCRRGLITDPTAHVVRDADADLEQNQPSGAEPIEMHVFPTSKVRQSNAVIDVYSYSFVCIAILDNKIRS